MQEYEIKYVNQFKAGKDGKPYMTKNGKPFVRVSVKVAEYGDQYISGLWFGADCPWQVGHKVELQISEGEYQGKKELKFEIPKREDKSLAEINARQNSVPASSTLRILKASIELTA